MSKNATKKGIEKTAKAVKKVIPQKSKPTKRELLLDIHKKLDEALERQKKIRRLWERLG